MSADRTLRFVDSGEHAFGAPAHRRDPEWQVRGLWAPLRARGLRTRLGVPQ